MAALTIGLLVRALALSALGAIAVFAYNLYQQRMRFRSLTTKYGIVCFSRPRSV
jgi:hypothetical protein